MKRMRFLVNPPRGTTMTTKKKSSSRRGAGKRRNPPKGFRSWGAWMAHIRPGAKKRARRNPVGGETVKTKTTKRRTRKNGAKHTSTAKRVTRRRRARRNPPSFSLSSIPGFVGAVGARAAVTTGGKIVARKARGLMKLQAGTVMGMAAEALVGLVIGAGISMLHADSGISFAAGAVTAPLETGIQRLNIPHVSDSLGDDGYYLGADSGLELVREGGGLAGYVGGDGRSQFGEYVGDESGSRFMTAG